MAKKTRRSKSTRKKPRSGARPATSAKPGGTDAREPEARKISKTSSAPVSGAQTQFIGAPIVDPAVIAGPVVEAKKKAPAPEPAQPEEDSKAVIADALIADAPEEDTPATAATQPEPKTEPKPSPAASAPPPQQQVVVKKQGFTGGVIGGLLAAVIGFGAAQFYPDGWPFGTSEELETALAAQSDQVDSLSAQLAALETAAADSSATEALDAQIADLSTRIDDLRTAVAEAQNTVAVTRENLTSRLDTLAADLTERVATLEKAPIEQAADAAVAGAVEAYEEEVAALREETRARFDALAADLQERLGEGNAAIVEALEANQRLQDERAEREAAAQAAEASARRSLALTELRAALDSGAPFEEPLAVLEDAPMPLPALAADGVPTAVELAEAFPPLAREALTVALRETSDGSMEGRMNTFFRTQLGIRSLTPREGDDPDAVLSRMEAAVAQADYATAVTEAAALPEAARAVLSDWLDAVETRGAALDAADALAVEMNTN